jgi:septal ring factor EnvC (AmiA/AmiB activator)
MAHASDIPPRHIAALKKQLAATNARLLSLERERRQLRSDIAYLTAWLKRVDSAPAEVQSRSRPTRARSHPAR